MKKLVSGTAQTDVESPLGAFCSEIKPRTIGETYFPPMIQEWDEDKWRRESKAREVFDQYLQHDVTFEK